MDACRSVSHRATQTLGWADRGNCLLIDIGLDHLTLARAALYQAILGGERPVRRARERGRWTSCAAPASRTISPRPPHPRPLPRDDRRLRRRARGPRRGVRDRRARADAAPSRRHPSPSCAAVRAHRRTGRRTTPGSRRATISTRLASSSRPAATAGGARSSKTPRRRGSASPGPPRPLAHHRPDAGGEAADDRAGVPQSESCYSIFPNKSLTGRPTSR